MKIDNIIYNRILIKDDNSSVNITDGSIIKYVANYYVKNPDSPYSPHIFETEFVGKVECIRSDIDGAAGIYVSPLYILYKEQIHRIINYKHTNPSGKYFYFPHLLMLPEKEYHYYPIYTLHTVENTTLDKYDYVVKTIDIKDLM